MASNEKDNRKMVYTGETNGVEEVRPPNYT